MIIQVLTIICQALTVCVLGFTIYWQRKAAKELRRADEIRARYHLNHDRR